MANTLANHYAESDLVVQPERAQTTHMRCAVVVAAGMLAALSSGNGLRAQGTASPLMPQGPELTGTGAITTINGGALQGSAVALSADGNTAIFGGDNDNNSVGAAWVFTRANGFWSQQQKLITSDSVQEFGISVALSGDGNTALVGSNSQVNAVWLYTRTNGAWGQPQKLSPTGPIGISEIGYSVALSQDGNTALIGCPADSAGVGAAWVFVRANGVWSQQGGKLVGASATGMAMQGYSVALSADGNTAISGGPADGFLGGSSIGAAWVFTRRSGAWDQGTKLIGNTTAGVRQGLAVAISGDGNTALVGGPYGVGGAWVFVRTGSGWSQQAGPLAGANADKFSGDGMSLSLNADGNVAIIGGPGANNAWLFTRANGVWTQREELTRAELSSSTAQLGYSSAISADTTTFLLGSPQDSSLGVKNGGGAWVFYSPPASIAATAGVAQTAFLGMSFATKLQATVTNTLGYASPGVTVTFAAPGSGSSGTFVGASNVATAVTNSFGVATAPSFTANQTPGGPYNVTASVSGVSGGANFALTNAPPAVNVILQTSPPNLLVSLDGSKLAPAPQFGLLVPGSSHTIATQSPQTSASGAQYSFVSWSDGQAISHNITVPITDTTYTATLAAAPLINAVLNAATNAPPTGSNGGLARGSFVTIYGSNLGPATGVTPATLPLQTALGGVTVTITPPNGGPQMAYPVYAASTQINAILLSAVPVGPANLTVTYNGAASQSMPIQVVSSAFGIFTANFGSGPAAVVDLVTPAPIVSSTNAAHPGDILSLYGTGLGPVNAPDNQAPGIVSPPGISVQVVVAGQSITPLYAGRAPQFPAEDQINFQLPAAGQVPQGCSVPIVVMVNGVASNSATLAISNSGSNCPAQ
jgi:uncharacterized protein (TIGR03437 family)